MAIATRQQKRVRATRGKILRAARSVFAEKGIDLTTIDDITDRAGVGKGTFYYHFTDKNEVVVDLMEKVLGQLTGHLEERCREATDLTSLLEGLIQVHIDFFTERWEDFVLFFQGRADLKLSEGYAGIDQPFMNYLETIESLVDGAISRRVPHAVLRRVACAVAGFLSGYYSFAVIAIQDEDVDRSLRSLKSALVLSLSRFISEAIPTQGAAP